MSLYHVKTLTTPMNQGTVFKKAVVSAAIWKGVCEYWVDYYYGGGPKEEKSIGPFNDVEDAIEDARKYVNG